MNANDDTEPAKLEVYRKAGRQTKRNKHRDMRRARLKSNEAGIETV